MAETADEPFSTPEQSGPELLKQTATVVSAASSLGARRAEQRKRNLSWFSVALVIASLSSIALIYFTLREITGETPNRQAVSNLLVLNGVVAVTLIVAILWQLITVWRTGKSVFGAARLHKRLVILFSFIAIVPAVAVAILAILTLTFSFDSLFGEDEPFPTAMGNLRVIVNGFVQDQIDSLRVDARTLAPVVDSRQQLMAESPIRFRQFLAVQSALRKLESAYIVDGQGRRLSSASLSGAPPFTLPSTEVFNTARQGKLAIFSDVANNQFRGIIKLQAFDDAYLLIGRRINPLVLDQMDQTRTIIHEFNFFQSNQEYVVGVFSLAYLIVALIVLLAAIRTGLRQADDLASPIDRLVQAAEKVSRGDLSARVHVDQDTDEVDRLSHTFNRMTDELQSQTEELVEANEQMDARRRFTEAVLAGVSAGVIGLDNDLKITIANRSAITLLATPRDALIGRTLLDVIPELTELLAKLRTNRDVFVEDHIEISRNSEIRHLNVQISGDHGDPQSEGYVVTFDDITKLVSAQRTAAWADVARRIAHEIKNPLTPIQLSAERLRRKYLDDISGDTDVFEQCTDTIVRQVKDIGRMVDEFSSFARMPVPVMKPADLTDLVKQVVFSQRVANPEIDYQITIGDEPLEIECDSRLIGQALTNILKNAAEGIATRLSAARDLGDDRVESDELPGRIDVELLVGEPNIEIIVKDNGCGLPEQHRNRLTEPYMTTREKGTGLGLAIVKKVMEDHGGELVLANRKDIKGADIRLRLPCSGSNLATLQTPTAEEKEANLRLETVGS